MRQKGHGTARLHLRRDFLSGVVAGSLHAGADLVRRRQDDALDVLRGHRGQRPHVAAHRVLHALVFLPGELADRLHRIHGVAPAAFDIVPVLAVASQDPQVVAEGRNRDLLQPRMHVKAVQEEADIDAHHGDSERVARNGLARVVRLLKRHPELLRLQNACSVHP